MDINREYARELAARIYDLDQKIYDATGSSISRVFSGERERSISNIAECLLSKRKGFIIRSDMALIGNMGRTIKDKKLRREIMTEYDHIREEVKALPTSWFGDNFLDPEIADLNRVILNERFNEHDPIIICIGRTCGACGNDIGRELSERLRMNFYDVAIINEMSDNSSDGNTAKHIAGEKKKRKTIIGIIDDFKKYHGLSERDRRFFDTTNFLLEKAKEEEFIVMGRFADAILSNNKIPHLSIFITAPMKDRVRRIMYLNENLTARQARSLIRKEDRKHNRIYSFYTSRNWGKIANYDICINSASFGIEGSVEMILRVIDSHRAKRQNG